MRPLFVLFLLLFLGSPTLAQEANTASGPALGDLLKKPNFFGAWQTMLSRETPPDWLTEYTATLNGPPVPIIPVSVNGQNYQLGFTCQPFECEDNQIYVLFAPDGSKAWALLVNGDSGIVWLGYPDETIQTAINGALKK